MYGILSGYRIKNIRSILDSGKIALPQLSVLVGKNGSGKSSFMRFFQILSQSRGVNKRSPLLLYGDEVDFGTFDDTKSKKTKDKYIGFGFEFTSIPIQKMHYLKLNNGSIFCKIENNDNHMFLSNIVIHTNDDIIEIEYNNKRIEKLLINNNELNPKELFAERNGFILPDLFWKIADSDDRYYIDRRRSVAITNIAEHIHSHIGSRMLLENIIKNLEVMRYCNNDEFLEHLSHFSDSAKWSKYIATIHNDKKELLHIKSLFTVTYLPEIISLFNELLRDLAGSIFYIGPVRSPAQRYYRIRDLDVSRIDPTGNNMSLFINSLNSSDSEDFRAWTKEHFDFEPSKQSSAGHISINIKQENEIEANLADVGFGYSQLLPILLQLWQFRKIAKRKYRSYQRSYVFLVEQPELHLHPAYQKKLLYAIVDTINYCSELNCNLKIILETHSETIVNELGAMIEYKTCKKNNISIFIFNKNNGICDITLSQYNKNGILLDWPLNFFDGD